MDNVNLYLGLTVIISGIILVLFVSQNSIYDKILRILGFVWVMGFVLWGDELLNLSGVKWLIAISPGFGILIYLKYKEMSSKKS